MDSKSERVSVFDSDGQFITVLGSAGGDPGQFWSPWSLTVDAKDRLLVSDTANQRVQILDLKSAPAIARMSWGVMLIAVTSSSDS